MKNPMATARPASASWLFAQPCHFIGSFPRVEAMPECDAPEIAIIGRSNVGKSSLLNCLFNRKQLAHVSNMPGRTQMLNLFTIATDNPLTAPDTPCYMSYVDLPGYGYATLGKHQKIMMSLMIQSYLTGRKPLTRVLVLIDCRRGIGPMDETMFTWLYDQAIPSQLVITKCDKRYDATLVEQQIAACHARWNTLHPVCHWVSSAKRTGIDDLQEALFELLL